MTDILSDFMKPFGHEHWMKLAFREAEKAYNLDEIPVGAVVVHNNSVIGRGHNLRETLKDPTAHAEMIALTAASEHLQNWRLEDCTLYVTMEPCPMCAGAVLNARISEVVYGVLDPKAGAVDSLFHLCEDPRLNHQCKIISGVYKTPIEGLIDSFFKKLRNKRNI